MTDPQRRGLLRIFNRYSFGSPPPDHDLIDRLIAKINLSNKRQTNELREADNRD